MIEYLMVCFISGEWIIIIIISGVFHIFFPPLYFFLLIKKKKKSPLQEISHHKHAYPNNYIPTKRTSWVRYSFKHKESNQTSNKRKRKMNEKSYRKKKKHKLNG